MLLNAEWVLICLHMGSSGCGETCSYFLFINSPFSYQSFSILENISDSPASNSFKTFDTICFVCFVGLLFCLFACLFVCWLVGPILLLLCFILSVD